METSSVFIDTETDFLLRFEEGKGIISKTEFANRSQAVINDIRHWGLFEHAPCQIDFPGVFIGKNAFLEFSIGVQSNAWENPGDGVRFQISALLSPQENKVLYSQYIDPKNNPADRQWFPQHVPIEGIQDTTVTLRFETFPGEKDDSNNNNSDYAFWANPRLYSQGRPVSHSTHSKPNILLITLDTTRVDYLRCYGNEWIQTPTLDRLAQEGVLFEHAYTACNHTNPSHVSILTSLSPFAHGVIGNENRLTIPLPGLPQILKESGYSTLASTSAYHLENFMEGLGKWFDIYDKPQPMSILPGSLISSRAIQRFDEIHDRPFFYWLHYYDPHQPYQALGNYHRMYYAGDPNDSTHHSMEQAVFPTSWDRDSSDSWLKPYKDLDYFRKEYGAEISYMDSELGRVFEALRRLHLDENTIVVAVADHGESMGEHGVYFDHWTPYDTDIRVPLILSYPKSIPKGRRITHPVSTLDIMPTLLDLIGESDNYLAQKLMEGKSLRRLWETDSQEEAIVAGMNGPYYIDSTVWNDRYVLIWELLRIQYHCNFQTFSDRVWVYDRLNDPEQKQPAACFYWREKDSPTDRWEEEKKSQSLEITEEQILHVKEKSLHKKIPSPDELKGWFLEKNGRDTICDAYLNDPDFFNQLVALLEAARRKVNPPTVWDRMKDLPDILAQLGSKPAYLQQVEPAMKEFLHSLGYVGQ